VAQGSGGHMLRWIASRTSAEADEDGGVASGIRFTKTTKNISWRFTLYHSGKKPELFFSLWC
jgi:hypothetical protein